MGFEWYEPPTRAFTLRASHYTRNIEARVVTIANRRAPEITAWMKANHPWQNRTGAAEAGLHTEVEHVVQRMIDIILSHGDDVDYAIWLETKFQGRDSVLLPALDYWGAVIWSDVQRLVRA